MKYKIVKHYNKENGHFTGYELMRRALFFLPWKSFERRYAREGELNHDLVWLLTLDGKVSTDDAYD